MNIAIISDTHDNVANIDKVLTYCTDKKAAVLIHCGDVCTPMTLVHIADRFSEPIRLSLGNVDTDAGRMHQNVAEGVTSNVIIYDDIGECMLDGKHIAINHYPTIAKKLAQSGHYDVVFHGHSHKPWEERVGRTRLVNPGNVANLIYPPSFAWYNTQTDDLQLIRVNEL